MRQRGQAAAGRCDTALHNALIPVAQRDQEAFRALMIVATLAGPAPALGAITLPGHWTRPGIQAAGVKTGERR